MNKDTIEKILLNYILKKSDISEISQIPLDQSLLATGVLDSFGIIELVEFIESNWDITIEDNEFTLEKMGSVKKMIDLIITKIPK